MAKLCYKVGGTVKKYDLKDSISSSPKLVVKVNGTVKYLGLRQGSKSGELNVKYNGLPYYGETLASPETVTPVSAPFGFGISHDEREPNYGKVFDYGETATASYSLGWAEGGNSAGAASYSTVQTFTSAHEYKYYPSDNGGSFDGRGWFKIYQHRHGRCIWIVAIVINGVEHTPNTELDIHVGDKIGMRFVINRDGGNGSDNFYGWSYYGRMNVRQLDL